jgi:hypothetical protein
VPSISGKTIGTTANTSYLGIWLSTSAGSTYASLMGAIGLQNNTIDIWGVQIEAGSSATDFVTASGNSKQGELAMCQRYYWRSSGNAANSPYAQGIAAAAGDCQTMCQYPVTMRVAPTSLDFSTLGLSDGVNAPVAITALALANVGTFATLVIASTAGGLTQYRYYQLINNNNTAGYFGLSAEL